jgi:hypothetical protein
MWVQKGCWKTPQEYIENHLQNAPTDRPFGATIDIHLFALYLENKNVDTRLVIHTKGTDDYMWHCPYNPEGPTVRDVCAMERLAGGNLLSTDIELVNTGNIHWSRAEWN